MFRITNTMLRAAEQTHVTIAMKMWFGQLFHCSKAEEESTNSEVRFCEKSTDFNTI